MFKPDPDRFAKSLVASAVIGIVVSVSLAACGVGKGSHEDKRGRGDVPTGPKDYTPPRIVNNADQYPNISVKCDGQYGYLIFTTTHTINDVPPVIVPDPRCPGWRPDLVTPYSPKSGGQAPKSDDGG